MTHHSCPFGITTLLPYRSNAAWSTKRHKCFLRFCKKIRKYSLKRNENHENNGFDHNGKEFHDLYKFMRVKDSEWMI